jgi:hypothetical protein
MVIIIVVKPWLGGQPRSKALVIDQVGQLGLIRGNVRIKNVIIVVLKPYSGVNWGKAQVTWLGGSTQVNPSQRIDKNGYYHSFKTWLGSRLEIRFKSWVRWVNSANPKFLMFFSKKSMGLVFYPKLTWVFDWVRLSQSFLYFSYTRTSSGFESTHQVGHGFITRVIIILLISTFNIN